MADDTVPDLRALPSAYREALAFFEAFRRCGFSADDLYLGCVNNDGLVQVSLVLRTQGKEATAVAGFVQGTCDTIETTWRAIVAAFNAGRYPIDDFWIGSMAVRELFSFPAVLAGKGIVFPIAPSAVH